MNVIKRIVLIGNDQKKAFVEKIMLEAQIGHKLVTNKVEGDTYVAVVDTDKKLDIMFYIAARLNHDKLMVVDELREASLHDVVTGDAQNIGSFRAVSPEDAVEAKYKFNDESQTYAVTGK